MNEATPAEPVEDSHKRHFPWAYMVIVAGLIGNQGVLAWSNYQLEQRNAGLKALLDESTYRAERSASRDEESFAQCGRLLKGVYEKLETCQQSYTGARQSLDGCTQLLDKGAK